MMQWLLTLLLLVVPPGRVPARETAEAGALRYAAIAADIAAVAGDPAEAPLFGGRHGRERTAVFMLAVAFMESGMRVDVDDGRTRGDNGRSCTLWQLNLGNGRAQGFSCAELLANRRKAAKVALASMRRSAGACRRDGVDAMLRVYASGSCSRGVDESRLRVRLAQRWFREHPPGAAGAAAGGKDGG